MTLRDKYTDPHRGIRMNNPGNIKEPKGGGIKWDGERATDDDPTFEEFVQPVYGIRALARILLTYQRKYGINTIRGFISRWAPGNENDTKAYVASVRVNMCLSSSYKINLSVQQGHFMRLIKAIIKHENGCQPFSDEIIWVAIGMALEE